MKTSFKKIIAGVTAVTIVAMNAAYAAPIGTGSIAGSGVTSIEWDGNLNPGTASGSVGITVSATVAPILSMDISSGSLSLGALASTYTAATTDLEIGTNAMNGATISAKSSNGGLYSASGAHTIGLSGNDALYAAEGYQFSSSVGVSDSVGAATISGVAATTVNTVNQAVTIYSADKPQDFGGAADLTFTVQSKIAASTPAASDYTDTITFTVTGNF